MQEFSFKKPQKNPPPEQKKFGEDDVQIYMYDRVGAG